MAMEDFLEVEEFREHLVLIACISIVEYCYAHKQHWGESKLLPNVSVDGKVWPGCPGICSTKNNLYQSAH
jgi:hypothetical protein